MNAFDHMITSSASTSATSDVRNKHEKRYDELQKRRNNSLKGAKGTANWWQWLIPQAQRDPGTDEITLCQLQCVLCEQLFSASNESRLCSDGGHLVSAAFLHLLVPDMQLLPCFKTEADVLWPLLTIQNDFQLN